MTRNYHKSHPKINNGDNIADATKTLKASSLINRGYERSEHPRLVVAVSVSTLQGRPFIAGAPLQGAVLFSMLLAGGARYAGTLGILC